MTVTRTFAGGFGIDDGPEICKWNYTDDAAVGAADVLMPGVLIPDSIQKLICTIKNNSGVLITWVVVPKWKGTNDTTIVAPVYADGFNLEVGDDKAVDIAYEATLAAGDEQGVVIDCSKVPRSIFLAFDPPAQDLDLSLFIKEM